MHATDPIATAQMEVAAATRRLLAAVQAVLDARTVGDRATASQDADAAQRDAATAVERYERLWDAR